MGKKLPLQRRMRERLRRRRRRRRRPPSKWLFQYLNEASEARSFPIQAGRSDSFLLESWAAFLFVFLQSLLSFTSFRSTVSLPISLFLPCLVYYFLFPLFECLVVTQGFGTKSFCCPSPWGSFFQLLFGIWCLCLECFLLAIYHWGFRSPPSWVELD